MTGDPGGAGHWSESESEWCDDRDGWSDRSVPPLAFKLLNKITLALKADANGNHFKYFSL